jgi:sulfite dehydrogenase (cytochrome) subunit A
MDKAYRIPTTPDGGEAPDRPATATVPINRLSLRSIFVRPEPGERLPRDQSFEAQGLAFDSGYGIQRVELSTDDGASWQEARLDPDLGKYSWRRWRFRWAPSAAGQYKLRVRASNRAGQQQPARLWNRGGYMRNVVEQVEVKVL